MLKPLDKKIEIHSIKLLEKKGGKTDISYNENNVINTAVIVCSDSVYAGTKEDKSGKIIIEKLKKYNCKTNQYFVVPDEVVAIQAYVKKLCAEGYQMIILTGGTGLSPRDITPEAIEPLLDREVKGISETIRNYGQQRMPYAMLSRSIAGIIGQTLVITMPGSSRGAAESVDAIFPQVTHIFKMMRGASHD
jgi:cyclic pyranopterin phosphate synthase